ncbi:MAG: DUF4080 domain-containing protein [Verrucomicrobia bacterium]|nr:DUF4080 domain-containing protein [Verrucomicrobiota bacterium]
MPDIVLATLNARYIHAAFGLRYLLANLGDLRPRAALAEFDINQRPLDIVEALLAHQPKIIGLGVYIWNVTQTTEVVAALKRLRPDLTVILGGPEVSYETETQEIVRLADHVITGEADLKFAEVCRALLGENSEFGIRNSELEPELPAARALPKIIPAELPDLAKLALPYELYSDDDVVHRVLYVEASRGCPFTCEFCLSSLDIPVRQFPLEPLLAALERLLARGVNQFKFVDRTFNLNLPVSRAILEFFHARLRPGLFVHFEMIPDRLPAALREVIAKFPPGALQFEVGVQTFDDATSHNISRRQDLAKLEDNFRFLRQQTGVHIHADLIIGLPGEGVESFAAGFSRLVALGPQEIQVGILKRLRGTPIVRHDAEWRMIYSAQPPYEILQNRLIDFTMMQRLRRFARYWDLVANSGNFVETTPLIWAGQPSPFLAFLRFSDWLYAQVGRRHGIALATLAEKILDFITQERALDPRLAAESLWRDYQRGGRKDRPGFLEPHLPPLAKISPVSRRASNPKRQSRHRVVTL